jgi:hypothetical protein
MLDVRSWHIPEVVISRRKCLLIEVKQTSRFALPWLMSFDARQQFFFQQSLALPEPLNLRLETIEELDDLAVLMTKRVKACVCRH